MSTMPIDKDLNEINSKASSFHIDIVLKLLSLKKELDLIKTFLPSLAEYRFDIFSRRFQSNQAVCALMERYQWNIAEARQRDGYDSARLMHL